MTRLRDRWHAADRADRALAVLFVAAVLVRVFAFVGIAGHGAHGDEAYYLDSGRALSNAVRDLAWFGGPSTAELERMVVSSGWFMPGMSLVLTPLFLVAPDAPIALVRGYLALFSTVLFLVMVLRARRTFGRPAAIALLAFPGLVPIYAVYGASAWGDTAAGMVVVLMLCRAVDLVRAAREHQTTSWRDGVRVGLLAIVAVYLRSSVSIVVVAMLGVTFVTTILVVATAERRRVVTTYVAAGAAFFAVLLPWSLAASASLDARVLTTVSVPTVRANTFGDPDEICLGECDPGSSIWFSPLRYSREQGRATGVSEVEIADEMSAYALKDLTSTSYARDVAINTGRQFGKPARFATLLRWEGAPYDLVPLTEVLTYATLYPMLLAMLVLLGLVTRRSLDEQLQLVLLKLGVIALLVQPFVHLGGPRYWPTLAPLLGIGVALAWTLRQQRRSDPPDGPVVTDASGAVARWLYLLQVGLGLFAGAVVVTIGLLAI